MSKGKERDLKVLSREDITNLIRKGNAIVIYEDKVLNLTSWLPFHPGGDKVVYHMVGRDATDEMNAYHGPETIKSFGRWKIGRIDYGWENMASPIQGVAYDDNREKRNFISLEEKIDVATSDDSEGEISLASTSSDTSNEQEGIGKLGAKDHKSRYEAPGFPKGKVTPVVSPNIRVLNKENVNEVYPIFKEGGVVDPKILVQNYDNALSRRDLESVPSLDYKTQAVLRAKYLELHDTVIKNGFYQCDYWAYVREVIKIGSLFLYSFSFLKLNYIFLSALLMGMAWQQMTFIAHDAGHISITHDYQIDNVFGVLISNWFGGLSLGWWKRNHNVHHLIPNDPVHDPDIQHLPFFAVSTRLFGDVYSTYYEKYLHFDAAAKAFIQLQNYLYYPILCFGRFNLYKLSWVHLLMGLGPRRGEAAWFRYFELAGLSFFFFWYFGLLIGKTLESNWDRFVYVMVSHIATMLIHVQITLSHFAMSTADLGLSESFPSRQIRTTMDVDCPQWLDFLHGGLQFQAIHHLFPRLPRHNFRRVQPFVIQFCKDVGLQYSIYGFGEGNGIVLDKLGDIAKQCSIMVDATKKLKDH
ncbi:Piso0_004830 [Millerozyma farinosa CBS 7064]|uniref:Delta 8-(E)-sphingolipid desaturase n=1 Tax=Pichia sorbitophila (strain ATCC MYA-4447 / BCRC 22081 / CBS 7064 / NBRC 10061 / NRRL Y-12695) TaxID=559304 RepID=G8Y3I0_PICSO|nr:Piso0_004830 [Millerozyma farinosa CBS 7064]